MKITQQTLLWNRLYPSHFSNDRSDAMQLEDATTKTAETEPMESEVHTEEVDEDLPYPVQETGELALPANDYQLP